MNHSDYMQRAIELARKTEGAPFAAILVDKDTGEVVAEATNRSEENPVLHAEVAAIQDCAHKMRKSKKRKDWQHLAIYTTAEPCPMCQSAIEWAGITEVYYGTAIPALIDKGWKQIDIRAEEVAGRAPFGKTKILGGVCASETDHLFDRPHE